LLLQSIKYQELLRKHDVQVFSSNYSLYQEMSARVMTLLAEFSPAIEVYSMLTGSKV
jgi:DNA polymerase V